MTPRPRKKADEKYVTETTSIKEMSDNIKKLLKSDEDFREEFKAHMEREAAERLRIEKESKERDAQISRNVGFWKKAAISAISFLFLGNITFGTWVVNKIVEYAHLGNKP